MKKLVFSILFVMQVCFVFAQAGTGFSGKVVDTKTQKPLQNVVATVQNTSLTEITNADGKFVFKNVPVGSQLLLVKSSGYKDQLVAVDVEKGKILDLGIIVLDEDITQEQQLSLVTITDNDLGDDNSGSESTSGLLQASRDVFQQSAAFNWGQARFRIRGLDSEYSTTMINGVSMNKAYDGRPQWSNWGGLNDATRNQEFTMGSAPSDYTFGGILGTQEINTRASIYRPGSRISFSGTNTNYSWRAMGTHASGMDKKGWAFVVSASRRWAQEGYFEGTDYSANSLFASVEKKINEKHSLNFTSIYAQNSRGKSSPNTQEVVDLVGFKYNSYWGWQDGRKRNSRDKNIEEPIMMLSHYWKINDNTKLTTNLAYQTGSVGNTRLEYPGANNPDPTYYKKLPNYYLNQPALFNDIHYDENGAPILDGNGNVQLFNDDAINTKNNFIANSQINWNSLYAANNTTTGGAAAFLSEQKTDDTQFSANTFLFSNLSNNIKLNAGANFRKLKSENYAIVTDLLGADYVLNADSFFTGDQAQFDLNNPNRQVGLREKFGYDYNLNSTIIDAFTQFKFTYNIIDFYLAQTFSRSEYQREGLVKTGLYPTTSFGKSGKQNFENFGFKGGLTYKLSGRHLFDFNCAYITKAPNLKNTFSNARKNNAITPELDSEKIMSADVSYIIRTPKFKSRLTGFASRINDATEIAFFYAEGVGEDSDGGDEDGLISQIITGINKKNVGIEFGAEYQVTSTIKATLAASYGQYLYDNNPNLKINNDANASLTNTNPTEDFGKAYIKNYRQSGTPQTAATIGLEYRDPHFWWIGANANYLADSYVGIANILRTENFVTENDGFGANGANDPLVKAALKQEKFSAFNLINLTGGKSWRVKNNTIGFFASINNIFDEVYKTGGFENARKATYSEHVADNANGTPSFGNKYFYGYGRTYFLNLYVNF